MLNVQLCETNRDHFKKRAPSLFLHLKVSFKSPPKKLIFQKLGHSGELCLSVKRCFFVLEECLWAEANVIHMIGSSELALSSTCRTLHGAPHPLSSKPPPDPPSSPTTPAYAGLVEEGGGYTPLADSLQLVSSPYAQNISNVVP